MDTTTNMEPVQEINTAANTNGAGPTGLPPVDAELSLTNESFADDMAKLRAQAEATAAPKTEPTPTVSDAPKTPEQPQVEASVTDEATKTVDVPDKFKTPDGKIDEAKLDKSFTNVEDKLAEYLRKEKELKRKMNEGNKPQEVPSQYEQAGNIQVSPEFAAAFEKDVQTLGLGAAVIRLQTATLKAAEEAAYARATKDIADLKEANSAQTTRQQIEAIGKNDPWVYTQEGINTLTQILDSQPYLWQAKDPYKAAYVTYKGMNVASRPTQQVVTPNPTARTSAPVPTAQAVAPVNTSKVNLNDANAIADHVKGMKPDEALEFLNKALGFPKK